MNRQIILVDWAGAVSITVIGTLAVLRTLVPTSTLRNLLGWLASLGISSKNISFAATKLVWFLKYRRIKKNQEKICSPCCGSRRSKICSLLDEGR